MHLGVPQAASSGLAGRLAWAIGLRLVFLTLFLGATASFYLRGDFAAPSTALRVAFWTIGVAFALGAAYAAALRTGRYLTLLADAQCALDQLVWTAIVYVTGGATSGATSIYALTALVGAILTGLRGAVIAALSGIAVYGLLCVAFFVQWIQPPADSPSTYVTDAAGLAYPLLVNTLGIVVVALLGGWLAERLRITGGALEAANQRARAAERLAELGRIAAGLAHEIRNPLGSISGSIEMLRESTALSEEDRQLCAIVAREAQRLNSLVSDMLDLSRPPRPPAVEDVDVAALAREVVALASRSERSASDVRVVYDGPDAPARARCDGAQMRQVVWNLVRNAVQASPAGKEVRVHVVRDGGDVRVVVSDEGAGIPRAELERIFDAFHTTRTHGAGIGLAVVKRILDDHEALGARVAVESRADGEGPRGTSFAVSLRAAANPPGNLAPALLASPSTK